MELKKRECPIKITLHPSGCQYVRVSFDFNGTEISFLPSSAVSGQFGDLVSALYCLYVEGYDCHNEWRQFRTLSDDNHVIHSLKSQLCWDNEGELMEITMLRHLRFNKDAEDWISIWITMDDESDERKKYTFFVDGRDFCYAVAKACTDVLRQYGFYGYRNSTEHDTFPMHQLLFIKAYALDNMEARCLAAVDEHGFVKKTDFEKEMELFLFDM